VLASVTQPFASALMEPSPEGTNLAWQADDQLQDGELCCQD